MSKQKILNASLKLFSELGYYRTSMDDIAREAGVAKGTLYYHFSSKGQLFETMVTDGVHVLMDEIKRVLDGDVPVKEQIRAIIDKHIELFFRYNELVHIISNEISNGIEPEVLDRIGALKRTYIVFLADILRQGNMDGEIIRLPYEVAAAGILSMIAGSCMYCMNNKERIPKDAVRETINAFVLSALLPSCK